MLRSDAREKLFAWLDAYGDCEPCTPQFEDPEFVKRAVGALRALNATWAEAKGDPLEVLSSTVTGLCAQLPEHPAAPEPTEEFPNGAAVRCWPAPTD